MSKNAPSTTAAAPAINLDTVADLIRRELADVAGLFRRSLDHARRIGELLAEVRPAVGHGRWQAYLADNFGMTVRTAHRYVTIFTRFAEITAAADAAGINLNDIGIARADDLLKGRNSTTVNATSAEGAAAGEGTAGGDGADPADPNHPDYVDQALHEAERQVALLFRQHSEALPTVIDRLRRLRDKLDRMIRAAEQTATQAA